MAYSGSASDRLAAVQASIARCLNTQEYWVGGRKQRMADLKDLRALEKELQSEANAESSGDSMASIGVYGGVE